MENKSDTYEEKLLGVKDALEAMVDIEASFCYLKECKDEYCSGSLRWEVEDVEIEINEILDDTYYLTVCVAPVLEAKKGTARCCIHYFYRISEMNIERHLMVTLDTPVFGDYGERVLDELIFILTSGNLILKNNAP